MKFISRDKSPEYVLRHGKREFVETVMGKEVIATKAATVKFTPLGKPFYTEALPARGMRREASGILDTSEAATRLKRRGHVFSDSEGSDVTEKAIIDFLFNHKEYGHEFIAINDAGSEIVDTIIYPEGDGGFYCRLCAKHFESSQGAEGHVASSKEHAANLEKEKTKTLSIIA